MQRIAPAAMRARAARRLQRVQQKCRRTDPAESAADSPVRDDLGIARLQAVASGKFSSFQG
jgi:hypothetical protein